jgi:signal-transduction protein with cAMP-binding, CBS, and nucleotidyltransferase domain
MAARNVMQQQTMREAILKQVERDIQAECTALCSKKNPSILSKVSSDNLMQLTDTAIVKELHKRAPILSRCMEATTQSKRSMAEQRKGKKDGENKRIPAISMAASILLRSRCSLMSANAYRMSTILWHSGVDKQVCLLLRRDNYCAWIMIIFL